MDDFNSFRLGYGLENIGVPDIMLFITIISKYNQRIEQL